MLRDRTLAEVTEKGLYASYLQTVLIALVALAVALQFFSYIITQKRIIRPVLKVKEQLDEISKRKISSEFAMQPGYLRNRKHDCLYSFH